MPEFIFILWIGFFGSLLATWGSIKIASILEINAHTDDRTLHTGRIPRLGGLGMLIGWLPCLGIGYFLLRENQMIFAMLSLLIASLGGFYDDWQSAKGKGTAKHTALFKLATQFIAAAIAAHFCARWDSIFISGLGEILFRWTALEYAITILWLVGMSNLFNFMDGSNGLAAGTAAIIGFFLFYWTRQESALWASILSFALAISSAGFLPFNFPKAKTFMGDCGSLVLGFGLALATIPGAQGIRLGEMNLWLVILIWSPFILDSSITLFKRALRFENIFTAHCSHYYQQLIKSGHSHEDVALLYWNLAILSNLIALYLFR
ncbi:MAG: hypothetical protein SGI71_02340 [Verrucomicrobiota bacterium]|nr:hypothetical protein [Verrucomicrobiota bacterium]